MYASGDFVMYGSSGVCRIAEITTRVVDKKRTKYYVVRPVYDERTTIYCPVDSDKVSIRRLLSREEICELIHLMPDTETEWIENDQQRKEEFTKILRSGDHKKIVRLIKTLHTNMLEKQGSGRKFHVADQKLMKEAEDILYGEFAHVLNIQPEQVVPFIMGELGEPVVE